MHNFFRLWYEFRRCISWPTFLHNKTETFSFRIIYQRVISVLIRWKKQWPHSNHILFFPFFSETFQDLFYSFRLFDFRISIAIWEVKRFDFCPPYVSLFSSHSKSLQQYGMKHFLGQKQMNSTLPRQSVTGVTIHDRRGMTCRVLSWILTSRNRLSRCFLSMFIVPPTTHSEWQIKKRLSRPFRANFYRWKANVISLVLLCEMR